MNLSGKNHIIVFFFVKGKPPHRFVYSNICYVNSDTKHFDTIPSFSNKSALPVHYGEQHGHFYYDHALGSNGEEAITDWVLTPPKPTLTIHPPSLEALFRGAPKSHSPERGILAFSR